MAQEKKFVEAITSMDEDFAQWYTDVVKKAELVDYSSVRGCMIIRPYGYAIWENIQKDIDASLKKQVMKMYICQCLFLKVYFKRKKIMLKVLLQKLLGLHMVEMKS